MANTAPFSIGFGLSAANNLSINASAFSTNNLVANTTGASTPKATANTVVANNIIANSAQFLSLVANLISMNVLSGNVETLAKSLTSNSMSVNTISGNTATFGNLTSNQVFCNTLSGNIAVFGNLSVAGFTVNNFIHVGDSTTYMNVTADAIYQSDSNGSAFATPLEVILQKGSVTSGSDFMIDFSTEVTSNAYKSMKLIMSNIQLSSSADLRLRVSSDGSTPITSSIYCWGDFGCDATGGAGGGGQDGDSGQGQSNARIVENSNSSVSIGCELIFSDTTTNSRIKSWYGTATGAIGSSGAQLKVFCGFANSSIVLKGVQIFPASGTFESCDWLLLGYRY